MNYVLLLFISEKFISLSDYAILFAFLVSPAFPPCIRVHGQSYEFFQANFLLQSTCMYMHTCTIIFNNSEKQKIISLYITKYTVYIINIYKVYKSVASRPPIFRPYYYYSSYFTIILVF